MAGNYPDVTARRMAWDRDGSVLLVNTVVQSEATRQGLNNEATGSVAGIGDATVVVFFPELRDLYGYHIVSNPDETTSWATSPDTTTGLDGTWDGQGSWTGDASPNKERMRTFIQSVNRTGIKAVRFTSTRQGGSEPSWYSLHLYGDIASGENPDRLRLWHPTSDAELSPAYLDWGDIIRGGAAVDRTFRVKNNSASLTAETIVIATQALTDTSPSVPPQFTYSTAALPTYTTTKAIADLGPGDISPVITIRCTTPSNATLSLWWARVVAEAASWA